MPNNEKTTWQSNGCKLNIRGKTTTRKLEESINRKDCESEDFNKFDCHNVFFPDFFILPHQKLYITFSFMPFSFGNRFPT